MQGKDGSATILRLRLGSPPKLNSTESNNFRIYSITLPSHDHVRDVAKKHAPNMFQLAYIIW